MSTRPEEETYKPAEGQVKVTDNRHQTIAERAAAAREAAKQARERVAASRPEKRPNQEEQEEKKTLYFYVEVYMKNGDILEPNVPLSDVEAGQFDAVMKSPGETFRLCLKDGTIHIGRAEHIDYIKAKPVPQDVQDKPSLVE